MDVSGSTGSIVNNSEIFEMLNKTFGGVFNCDLEGIMRPSALMHPSSPPTPIQSAGIPGALAVAQSPAAQLFSGDDWSWHRNPAASIRSGGTNKQTPVWKYFVYNKTENLSRCIVGDCTYMLKGPHTSTLACHLKKHTREYSEFQKLKTEYSRTKLDQQPKIPDGAPHPLTLQTQNTPRQTGSPASTCNTNSNTSSSVSSGSGIGSGSGSTMDLSMKKPKKEPSSAKLNEMLFNGLRQATNNSNGSPPTTPHAPQLPNIPSFVTNMMLQMNPLHMMLAQSLPGATPPTPTSSNAGLNALQQAGLTLAANGQIIQSKKWRNDDKKQKELCTKFALALATSHVDFEVVQNPLWKEVFEMAQPKFSIPTESQYEHIVNSTSHKLIQSLKSQLSASKKLNLLLDITKITADISRVTVSVALTGGAGNSYETQVILLAFRNINGNQSEDLTAVFEKVLQDYNISPSSINRVICSGLNELAEPAELPKQMDSFSSRLANCFKSWLETSPTVEVLKKNVYAMLVSYLTVPAAIQLASQMLKAKFEVPLTEPFHVIVEHLVAHRDIYQMNMEGITLISEREWNKVTGIHHLMNIFKPFMTYSTDMTTVDTVIPTIVQIQNVLEKDIYHLGDIGSDLLTSLKQTVAPIMNPEHENFDSTYIQATALNPQLAVTLTSDQMTTAKSLIETEISRRTKKMRKAQSDKKLAMGVDSLLANVMRKNDGGSDGGCETALAIYGDLFQSITGNSSESKENIVNQYFDEISSTTSVESMFMLRTFGNPMQAPLSYWKSCSSRCSELSDLATELLSIPIFTLTAERVLSFSPDSSSLNTNLILTNLDSTDQFEKQVLLRFNRQIVSKLFN
ncbi:HAT C-terminal dimerization domain-containing protein [Caenorhabditis elegans]|nr:HAT C-terminal dimerization domain-containing protein [Caenorhabditis elegans]SBV53369.1 HAT C-terminal dimerisation domain-containing protein [Caenorhabditis elegans]|eukprot:NP_001317876.1 Zinc finger BED domain-containing protein 39 [Caenorhabditis elegans]